MHVYLCCTLCDDGLASKGWLCVCAVVRVLGTLHISAEAHHMSLWPGRDSVWRWCKHRIWEMIWCFEWFSFKSVTVLDGGLFRDFQPSTSHTSVGKPPPNRPFCRSFYKKQEIKGTKDNIMKKMEGEIGSEELWQQWAALPLSSLPLSSLSPSLPLPPPPLLSLPTLYPSLPPSLSCPELQYMKVSWVWLHCSVEKGRAALPVRCAEGWCTRRNAFTRCVMLRLNALSVGEGCSHCVWPHLDSFPWQVSIMLMKLPR